MNRSVYVYGQVGAAGLTMVFEDIVRSVILLLGRRSDNLCNSQAAESIGVWPSVILTANSISVRLNPLAVSFRVGLGVCLLPLI